MARRQNHEGTAYRDGNGWIGELTIDGVRLRRRARTKTEAIGAVRAAHDERARGITRQTVAELLDDWQAKHVVSKPLSESTVAGKRWAVRIITDHLGTKQASKVTVADVERMLTKLGGGDGALTKDSLQKIRSVLAQALEWAMARQLLDFNPAGVAEMPSDHAPAAAKRALTQTQVHVFLDHTKDHPLNLMWTIMVALGLRPGEAAGLCGDVFTFGVRPHMQVRRAVRMVHGRPVLGEKLKTTKSKRTIALPQPLADRIEASVDGDGLLFPGRDGGPRSMDTLRAQLERASVASGVGVVKPNELRHTFSTLAAETDTPTRMIVDILGHTSERMFEQTYRHRRDVVGDATLNVLG